MYVFRLRRKVYGGVIFCLLRSFGGWIVWCVGQREGRVSSLGFGNFFYCTKSVIEQHGVTRISGERSRSWIRLS